jgi:hypothetical protein
MVQRLDRLDFLENYFDYKRGDHVSIIGPTQIAGKTHLAHQLLDSAASQTGIKPVSFVMKPRDETVANWSGKLKFKEIDQWPPPKWKFWEPEPRGYTLWPKHSFDPERDNEHMKGIFRRALLDQYKNGDSITFADEVYGVCVELGMPTELTALWTRGGGMGAGLWSATQKPSGTQQGGIPSFVYNSPSWLFLSRDPDKRNRDRFNEIGGIDGNSISEITQSLKKHEFLVVHREGPYMSIISP